jgi:carbon monoxide dehydrogenase subunit G
MELEHDFAVPAPVDQVWAAFLDLEDLGTCFPGATVTDVSAGGFKGTAKVKLGPIALVYTGTGTWVERDEHAHRMVLEAKGKDKRGNGTAGATITIVLAEESPGRTFVHVLTDLNVTGKPAQFGRGVMQDVSDKLLQQFVDCLEGRFADGAARDAAVGADGMPVQDLAATAGGASGGGDASAGGIPARPAAAHGREVPDVVDLGAAAGPVLLKQFGPLVGAGLLGLLIGWLLGRRR